MIALDLGSNTLRGVKYDCESSERLAEYEKIIKTADNLYKSGIISKEAIARVIGAVNDALDKLGRGESVSAVATAALRLAKNQKAVIDEIKAQTGVAFDVISGEDEAYYVSLAVKSALERLDIKDDFMLIDIGGGSTEVIFYCDDRLISQSFDIGIVTIAQKYGHKDTIIGAIPSIMVDIKEFLKDMQAVSLKPKLFCATAGTPTTVAALRLGMDYATYDASRINGYFLAREDLGVELNRLLKLGTKERERLVGVGRADLIIAGILMFDYVFELTKFESCLTIDDGLREGVAMEACKKGTKKIK